jgi:uncharacterized protein (DUF1786 family)
MDEAPMTQTIDQNSPPQHWQTPTPPSPTKTTRAWKTWHLIAVGLVGLLIGAVAGGGSSTDSTKVKDAQAQAASAKTQAATDVAAADKRATDAVNVAKTQVEKDAAARTATLDKRSADLDARSAALDARDVAVSGKEAAKKASTFEDGTYQVGVDIIAGTYHTDGGSGCYWEKSTGAEGIDGIIGNDNVTGPVTLVIEPSVKFFKASRCGTWTKR